MIVGGVAGVIMLITCILVLRRVRKKSVEAVDYNKSVKADLDMVESEDEYSTTDQEEWQNEKQYEISSGNYLMVDIVDALYICYYDVISEWIIHPSQE